MVANPSSAERSRSRPGRAANELPTLASSWATAAAEVYDTSRKKWTEIAPLPYKAYAFNAIAPGDGRIYLLGCSRWREPIGGVPYVDVPTRSAPSRLATLYNKRASSAVERIG